jgi:hypothetical protein
MYVVTQLCPAQRQSSRPYTGDHSYPGMSLGQKIIVDWYSQGPEVPQVFCAGEDTLEKNNTRYLPLGGTQ